MTTQTRELTCNFIDVCYPDYLTDHHWRQNETLVLASIWEGMTTEDIVSEIWDCLNSGANDIFSIFSESEIKDAIKSTFDDFVSRDFGLNLSFLGIEPDESDDKEDNEVSSIYLYAYFAW